MEIMLAGICPCKARGKHEKIYLVVIVLFFISTKVYTLLHNNIFFVETARSVICLMFSLTTGSRFQAHR